MGCGAGGNSVIAGQQPMSAPVIGTGPCGENREATLPMKITSNVRRTLGVAAAALLVPLVGVPVASAEDPAPLTVAQARTKILGPGWDNPNTVRVRSIGNTTQLFSFGGTVLLSDSTIEDQLTDTGANSNTNGFVSLKDVIAAKPVAILQNHIHMDQNHNVIDLTIDGGIPLVTDLGGCLYSKVTAIKFGKDPAKLKCNLLRDSTGKPFFTGDSWAGGLPYLGQGLDLGLEDLLGPVLSKLPLNLLGQKFDLTAFLRFNDFGDSAWPEKPIPGLNEIRAVQVKHTPSFVGRPYPNSLSGPQLNIDQSIKDIIEDYAGNPLAIAENVYRTYATFDLEGSNVAWVLRYKDFSIVQHGSTGATYALEPGAKEIRAALDKIGDTDRVDLEIGGVAEMTFFTDANYFADNKDYSTAIGAKRFMPTHHYNWYPLWLTNPAATYWPGLSKTWADGKAEHGDAFPDLCFLTEDNYETLWDVKVDEWAGDAKGEMRPVTGPGCYTGGPVAFYQK